MNRTTSAAALLAAVLSCGLAGAAYADQRTAEARVTGPRGETDHSFQTDQFGEETIEATALARNAPSQGFIQADASAHVAIVPNLVAFSQIIQNLSPGGQKGLSEGFGQVSSNYTDTITLNGTPAQAGTMVTLHNIMTLQPSNNSEALLNPTASGDFVFADTHGELDILGTGIGPGPFGGGEFLSFEHHYRNSSAFSSSDNLPPDTVDFAMNLVLGQSANLSITQLLTVTTDLNDQFGGAQPVLQSFVAWGLSWGDTFFVTLDDAQGHDTGVRLNGVSSTSTSGFQYLSAAAPGEPGGVPEPTSWALMIGGLGLTGATLRGRRAVLAG